VSIVSLALCCLVALVSVAIISRRKAIVINVRSAPSSPRPPPGTQILSTARPKSMHVDEGNYGNLSALHSSSTVEYTSMPDGLPPSVRYEKLPPDSRSSTMDLSPPSGPYDTVSPERERTSLRRSSSSSRRRRSSRPASTTITRPVRAPREAEEEVETIHTLDDPDNVVDTIELSEL
jgi:hypothetical protein